MPDVMSSSSSDTRVAQTTSQWLFSEEALDKTPSILAGLDPGQERQNRAKGINFILQAGIMLKLPRFTLSTASVYLHRFFTRHSMIADKATPGQPFFHYYSVAAACLFLATKVEENCRKMKELVVACVRVAQKDANKVVDEQDKEFWRWRDAILQLEDQILETLCFDLALEQPYTFLFDFLKHFREENNKPLRNAAWSYVSDSFMTPACLIWPSQTIAASALYAAARHTDVTFLDDELGRPWWEVVGVSLKNIRKATNFIASIYEHAPFKRSSEENMHQRTPEDGDELEAKTRQRRPEEEVEANRKRAQAEEDAAALASKASRPDTSANGEALTPANGMEVDNVSEEGEVED